MKEFYYLFMNVHEFGWKLVAIKLIDKLCSRFFGEQISDNVRGYKHRVILAFLENRLYDFLKDYNCPNSKQKSPNSQYIIWQCWWQGVSEIQGVASLCMMSVKKANPDAEIIIITKDNGMSGSVG